MTRARIGYGLFLEMRESEWWYQIVSKSANLSFVSSMNATRDKLRLYT